MSPYPKRLETLLERIYENYPKMRRNPDFKYFYLFQSYPNNVDTFLVLTSEVLDWDDDIHSYLRSISQMLGFEFAMMKWSDFDSSVKPQLEKVYDQFRGGGNKVVFYEVW
jgi:hypothetical protein